MFEHRLIEFPKNSFDAESIDDCFISLEAGNKRAVVGVGNAQRKENGEVAPMLTFQTLADKEDLSSGMGAMLAVVVTDKHAAEVILEAAQKVLAYYEGKDAHVDSQS